MSPRRYHAALIIREGFALCFIENDNLVEVPEAQHMIFASEAEAFAFAEELERTEPGDTP